MEQTTFNWQKIGGAVVFVVALALIGGGYYWLQTGQTLFTKKVRTVNDLENVPQVTTTGAIAPEPTLEERIYADQTARLRKQVPLTTKEFSIKLDYNTAQYVVTLNEPKDQSRQAFEQWLKDLDLGDIPRERLRIE